MTRVLVIGPAGPERSGLETMLTEEGHETTCASLADGDRLRSRGGFDAVIVVDRRAPGPAATAAASGVNAADTGPMLLISGTQARALSRLPSGGGRRRGPTPGSWITPLASQSDEDIARLVKADSAPAFEELHRRYTPRLQRYCLSMLRRPADAEEAVQATMLNAFQALRRGQVDTAGLNVRPWLFRIAKNTCLDVLRRRGRQIEGDSEAEPVEQIGLHRIVAGRAELRQVIDDLTELSEEQRTALVLREFSGLSHLEIADALHTDATHAKSLVAQARASLAAAVAGRELSCASVRERLMSGDGRTMRSRELKAHLRGCPECAARAPRSVPAQRRAA